MFKMPLKCFVGVTTVSSSIGFHQFLLQCRSKMATALLDFSLNCFKKCLLGKGFQHILKTGLTRSCGVSDSSNVASPDIPWAEP